MPRTLEVTGNHVKFAHMVLLPISEEATTTTTTTITTTLFTLVHICINKHWKELKKGTIIESGG